MSWCRGIVAGALVCLGACAVDERELTTSGLGDGSMGGSAGDSAGSGGRAPSEVGDGAGAAGEGADGLVDGCADLDTDGISDCTTTLVTTPTFTEDVSGWAAVDDAQLVWDAKNALSDGPSGSARLTASTVRASAAQCLELSGPRLVIAYAQVFSEAPDDDEEACQGQLQVAFFTSEDCSGDSVGFFETPPSTEASVWTTVQAGGLSEEGTRSLGISLVGVKSTGASMLSVYFDNVMLKAQALD